MLKKIIVLNLHIARGGVEFSGSPPCPPKEMSQPTYLLYLGNTQIPPTKQIPSSEAVAQRAVVPSRGDRTMKKLLVLLAVIILATSTSGCTSCTECANFATCNCCKRLRDWCFRGAYCNQNMAAVTAPVYAAPAAPYAAGPPQAVAAPAPQRPAAPPPLSQPAGRRVGAGPAQPPHGI